eukprot:scaffold23403_cov31-Tisochrysis_lutea.AAC.2
MFDRPPLPLSSLLSNQSSCTVYSLFELRPPKKTRLLRYEVGGTILLLIARPIQSAIGQLWASHFGPGFT